MAEHYSYYDSRGPYYFDDTEPVEIDDDGEPSGLPLGQTQHAVTTSGQLWVDQSPTDDNHVLRKKDATTLVRTLTVSAANFDNPDLSSYSGALLYVCSMLPSAELTGLQPSIVLYAFYPGISPTTINGYIQPGSGGYWVAIAGKRVA